MEKQSQNQEYVSLFHDDKRNTNYVRVKALGLDFLIPLHDELNGRWMTYEEARAFRLPDEKKARLIGLFRKEIYEIIDRTGGDQMDGIYWTSTPAEEVFGAYDADYQLIFYGTDGCLCYYTRIGTNQVRVALDFDHYQSLNP